MKILENEFCKIHPDINMRQSMKKYCPECEGYFSASGFNQIKDCPLLFSINSKQRIDHGRAYPLISGTIAHNYAEIFNSSLQYIDLENLDFIFKSFKNFRDYMKILLGAPLLNSGINRLYSFFLFKRDLYIDFKNANSIESMIPFIIEEWLFIPFNRMQFQKIFDMEKPNMYYWTQIGVHNIIDEVIIDTDGKAIIIDYKSYPRKQSGKIGPIRSQNKKYQLITGFLTAEYTFVEEIDVKYIMNVDLGTGGKPNISYYLPTARGITYYKKALFEAYKTLFSGKFVAKFNKRTCLAFCSAKHFCDDNRIKKFIKIMNGMTK
jgi:hypothetical protein